MAPTSDERREVAAMMRGPFDVYRCCGGVAVDGTIYGMTVRADCDGALRDGMRRLADLMDPTCHVIPGEEAVAELKDGTRLTGVPLSCGHVVFGVSAKDMPKFCCECGSRITRGGER